ncbi:hypothetical protein J5N97_014501 [Dioscorea zingiberensis]|uniref:Protein kinase domain-containing protein n=1 Tax=Dioscorea zingiberensis TaxID=325984 RepID=A0A9D5CU25_9LILI|nr:hypothetical protein J5N97_014501 [Dioscorea zingiberensis]
MKEYSYEDIEAATKGFALDQLIGKGSHGCVYKGTLRGGKQVAVKKPLEKLQELEQDSKLDHEIDILASLHGNHLVNLLGVSHSSVDHNKHKLLVMEFMPNGSLHDLLHSSHSCPPSWPRRVIMALQIAQAVLSLHEAAPAIIHRDVKSANILFDRHWNARLADFSLAVRDDTLWTLEPTRPAGTFGYLDPWYTTPEKLSPKNDVFSFGVVLLEILSSRKVMDVACHPASIVAWAVPLIRARREVEVYDGRMKLPQYMEGMIKHLLYISMRCVSSKEKRRPTMAEVAGELQDLAGKLWCPIWACRRVYACFFPWRRWAKRKVSTTKIVCKDHLFDGNGDEDGDDSDDIY